MSPKIKLDREKIAAFCQRWKIAELSLFGSALRDDFGPESDVDLMVVGEVDEVRLHAAVSEVEKALARTVNYTLLAEAEFRRRRSR